MNKRIAKYFWGFNRRSLQEAEKILKNPEHPKFTERLVTLLSRCDQPKELFSIVTKECFLQAWPKARRYWVRMERSSDFRDWWQAIYEQIIPQQYKKKEGIKASRIFLKIGRDIRNARIRKNLSQAELALMIAMRQPDLSKIEEGKKNITISTLAVLCKALGIKKIDLG